MLAWTWSYNPSGFCLLFINYSCNTEKVVEFLLAEFAVVKLSCLIVMVQVMRVTLKRVQALDFLNNIELTQS